MKLNRTGSNWDRLERNKINENWGIIEGNHNKLEGEFNDVIGKITDEVVGHLIDSAKLDWKEPVDTVEDLPASAEVGETRMVREADPDGISYVYRYDGEKWEKIQAIDVTLINEVDRRLTRQLADTMKLVGVNVKDFGAVGDGLTDDGIAIKNAHDFANEHGLAVNYEPEKHYYISDVSNILIKTSTNFNGSKLIFNDAYEITEPIYRVVEDEESFLLPLSDKPTINRNTKTIPELAGNGMCFVVVKNSNKQQYIRLGFDESHDQTDFFVVNNAGEVLSPITYDFDDITSVEIQPISKDRITIKNADVVTLGLSTVDVRVKRNFQIMRSNVIIENIEHDIENNTSNVSASEGIFFFNRCANITLSNSQLTPRHETYRGSYAIRTDMAIDITFEHVVSYSDSPNYWGAVGGNRMKNALFRNSKLNRIDSHIGSHNITIDNSTIGDKGITVVGFGDLVIKNSQIYANRLVDLRNDYGAFWNGNIIIDNVDHYPIDDYRLVHASGVLDHDFGYETMYGKGIISVKDYTVHNENIDEDLLLINLTVNGTSNRINEYPIAENFVFENCQTTNKDYGFILINNTQYEHFRTHKDFKFKTLEQVTSTHIYQVIENNMEIVCKNVQFADLGFTNDSNIYRSATSFGSQYTDNFEGVTKRLLPKFIIEDCGDVHANLRSNPAILIIRNCKVKNLLNFRSGGSKSRTIAENCVFEPHTTTGDLIKVQVNRVEAFFSNCKFNAPILSDGSLVTNSDFKTVYHIFPFALTGRYVQQRGNFSNCTLDSRVDKSSLIDDEYASYAYDFGNHTYNQVFIKKRGNNSQRPSPEALKVGDTYFDTSKNKLITWVGHEWLDADGNVA